MATDDASMERSQRVIRTDDGRHEKGSAMTLIAEEARATEGKTARLRALRLEREAAIAAEPAEPVRKPAKRAARR